MDTFERDLVNKLLDKYESSKLSKGGTKVSRNITLTPKDKVLSSYNSIDAHKYITNNDYVIKNLTRKGFIDSKYNNETFISLTLNIDNIESLYKYIGRENPKVELEKIKLVLGSYKFSNFIAEFINYVYKYIESNYDYPHAYFSDAKQLDLILKGFKELEALTDNCKKREFSVKSFGDSKVFESIEGKIIKIIKDFNDNEYESDSDLLAAYYIIENPTYALVKNKLVFKIDDYLIDLNKFKYEFSLSDDMIKVLEFQSTNITKVVTVENLTTFYSFNDSDAVIVYLGGFHNHTKQLLLKKIYTSYPHAAYYHFGDIDVGGISIFQNLITKTSIPFQPYKMGIKELEESKVLKKLTNNDIKNLTKMLNNPKFELFKEIIEYMLKHNVKLEQESLE